MFIEKFNLSSLANPGELWQSRALDMHFTFFALVDSLPVKSLKKPRPVICLCLGKMSKSLSLMFYQFYQNQFKNSFDIKVICRFRTLKNKCCDSRKYNKNDTKLKKLNHFSHSFYNNNML
jgi:hypothetical protein